ncbi:MAG: hypothetical protein WC520_03985, partial [Candidatus Paceibacterota bacterium]
MQENIGRNPKNSNGFPLISSALFVGLLIVLFLSVVNISNAAHYYSGGESQGGLCGSADGDYLTLRPGSNLCERGEASSVSGSGPWTWTCWGPGESSDDYCTAYATNDYTDDHNYDYDYDYDYDYNHNYDYDYNYNHNYNSNRVPTVDAGSNKEINAGSSIRLNATASDADGDSLTYSWSCTRSGNLSSYNILNPTFYGPYATYNETYTCTLTVYDNR